MTSKARRDGVDFTGFVASLAATAAATLQQIEAHHLPGDPNDSASQSGSEDEEPSAIPDETQLHTGLATARHLIDTLVMLEEKTKGNLTRDEHQLLQTALTDLRITYVRISDRVRGEGRSSP